MDRIRMIALALGATMTGLGVAGVRAEDAGQRQQGAHVHGIAHMTLAAEGPKVLVEVTSPAASLIGFEHAPRTDEERATLALAKENLEAGDAMIRLNIEARCRLEAAEIDAGFADSERSEHGTRAHDQGTDHGEDGHADFHVVYTFACDRPEELGSAALGLFSGFPALERVLFQYVTAEGQGGAELTPRAPVVLFVPL